MKKQDDEKRFDEIISKAADFGKVQFDAQKWKEKYLSNQSIAALRSNERPKPHKNFWRIIMENKVTKYSAAAVVALAITLVLLGPFGTPGNGGVVLAEVQQNVDSIKTMIIRGTKTFMQPGEDGEIFEFDGVPCVFDLVKYYSRGRGFVEEGYAGGELFYRITFDIPKQQTLLIFPPYKKYLTFPSQDGIARIMEKFSTPNGVVDLLLEEDYKKLGKNKIDDVEVEGFEFQSIEHVKKILPKPVFDIQDYTGKIWIGVKEQLPVRIEADLSIGKSFMTMFNELHLHEVNVLDKVNIEIDKDTFDIEPPEGYTQVTLSDILQMVPAEARAGAAAMGVIPAGFIFWRWRRRKKVT